MKGSIHCNRFCESDANRDQLRGLSGPEYLLRPAHCIRLAARSDAPGSRSYNPKIQTPAQELPPPAYVPAPGSRRIPTALELLNTSRSALSQPSAGSRYANALCRRIRQGDAGCARAGRPAQTRCRSKYNCLPRSPGFQNDPRLCAPDHPAAGTVHNCRAQVANRSGLIP